MNMVEMTKGWIEYATNNGIRVNREKGREPTVTDVKDYLNSIGFDEEVVGPILSDVGRYVDSAVKGDMEKKKIKYTEKEIYYINLIKDTMRDKSDRHKMQLLRILKHEQ